MCSGRAGALKGPPEGPLNALHIPYLGKSFLFSTASDPLFLEVTPKAHPFLPGALGCFRGDRVSSELLSYPDLASPVTRQAPAS